MIIYRCDRCGEDDELHARQLDIEMVGTQGVVFGALTNTAHHLCGFCFSKFREWITLSIPKDHS